MSDTPIRRPDEEESGISQHVEVDSARREIATVDQQMQELHRDKNMGIFSKRKAMMGLIDSRLEIQRKIIDAALKRADIRVDRELKLFEGMWGEQTTMYVAGLGMGAATEYLRMIESYEKLAFRELKRIAADPEMPPDGKARQKQRLDETLTEIGSQIDGLRRKAIQRINDG